MNIEEIYGEPSINRSTFDEIEAKIRLALTAMQLNDALQSTDYAELRLLVRDLCKDLDNDHRQAFWFRFSSDERAMMLGSI